MARLSEGGLVITMTEPDSPFAAPFVLASKEGIGFAKGLRIRLPAANGRAHWTNSSGAHMFYRPGRWVVSTSFAPAGSTCHAYTPSAGGAIVTGQQQRWRWTESKQNVELTIEELPTNAALTAAVETVAAAARAAQRTAEALQRGRVAGMLVTGLRPEHTVAGKPFVPAGDGRYCATSGGAVLYFCEAHGCWVIASTTSLDPMAKGGDDAGAEEILAFCEGSSRDLRPLPVGTQSWQYRYPKSRTFKPAATSKAGGVKALSGGMAKSLFSPPVFGAGTGFGALAQPVVDSARAAFGSGASGSRMFNFHPGSRFKRGADGSTLGISGAADAGGSVSPGAAAKSLPSFGSPATPPLPDPSLPEPSSNWTVRPLTVQELDAAQLETAVRRQTLAEAAATFVEQVTDDIDADLLDQTRAARAARASGAFKGFGFTGFGPAAAAAPTALPPAAGDDGLHRTASAKKCGFASGVSGSSGDGGGGGTAPGGGFSMGSGQVGGRKIRHFSKPSARRRR